MGFRTRMSKEGWLNCSFDKYKGEKQYLWKVDVMLPITKLIKQEMK